MKIKDLLSSEDRWTKYYWVKDKDGNEFIDINRLTNPEDFQDYCYCLSGALMVCYPNEGEQDCVRAKLKKAILQHEGYKGEAYLTSFNDRSSTTFDDIKAVLELADV